MFTLPTPKTPLAKHMRTMMIILVAVFGLVFLFDFARHYFLNRYFAHFALPTVTVSSSKATATTWTPTLNSVGSLVAVNGVEVSPEVPGMVTAIYFNSGQMVQAGQPLVQLDARADQEDLKNWNAQLQLNQMNYQRQVDLMKTHATSQSSLDQASAQYQQSLANVAKTQVLISQKTIKAPFSGKIGIRNVNLGQYVSPGNGLVSLQSLDPLYAQFSLPEQNLKLLSIGQSVELTIDNYPDVVFKGKITAIDATVNTQTRNILVQATFPNADHWLYPGMFANIKVLLPSKENVVTVPQTAVVFSLYGDSIFVVKQEGKDKDGKPVLIVHKRYVTTGDRRENAIAVVKGLQAGEEIVNSGQLKLDDGMRVLINNSVPMPQVPAQQMGNA